jgi:hypothetical protein
MAELRILKAELSGEVPDEMIKYVSTNGRFKKGWIDESIRMQFIDDCTKLAFRKRQFRLIKSDDKIKKEIELLREKIKLHFNLPEKEKTI